MKNSYCAQWRELHSGQTNYEAKSRRVCSSPWGGQMSLLSNWGAVRESLSSGRRGKTLWGKPVSAINTVRKKSGSVALRPVEIPPLYQIWRIPTAYLCSNTSFTMSNPGAHKPSRLVNWLRVLTPMRAIRVRAWVEVVGSVMEFISFQSSMKCQKFSGATLREKRKARCPRMNSFAKYLALQYIRRYIAEFNEIECCSSQYSGKIWSHWPWSESRRVGSSPW